ncbi:adenylate/guanylate cyclase domain-containing protein [Nocardioides marmoriginsengisoli]|uniref:Adenylate/guanylate cyclase domain-containing protein n=1 Tax=Nocardioides marmoriginsengisoli TaxID=661483 RepID=A0A3N0CHM1_9ACTN|nr:adenylate/guanylate cyclase domain-containing protein [Nocardioides marmoriginsengisoli]RNL62945.1 adenylate/guanylate cyclase domain-containing protein [Nocardioides marmoriginsengisoli]
MQFGAHGLHGPDLRGVRPYEVIGLVWFANLVGAVVLIIDYLVVLPFPADVSTPEIERGNVILGLVLVGISWVVLGVVGAPRAHRALDWTLRGMPPDEEEQQLTLNLPWWLFWMQVVIWAFSCVVFFYANLDVGGMYALQLSTTVIISGLATAATSYLLCMRLFKSATTRVLELSPPRRGTTAGVGQKAIFIYTLTTGVPMIGLIGMVAFANETGVSLRQLSISGLVVGLGALITGYFATVLFAKSVGEPLGDLTSALAEIEGGDLSVTVTVDDAGEIGQLQSGVNNMVAALLEREQLRDLFGRHVGEDVARLALQQGVSLGGEEREVAALFVDVIGSTTYAATHPAAEVVAALNRFFEVVVSVVSEHGGLVNKFEGDAALCIFGAPLELPDPAAAALAAARTMSARLKSEVPDLDAGIGVSHGLVIAGNIGSAERLEYTVIGDAVNEAARLTEQAKDRPERVVASERIVDRAGAGEQARWRLLEPMLLRGRLDPTTLAVPV